jgi:hypothetical protein
VLKLLLIKAMADRHLYSHFAEALRQALTELGHEATISDQFVNVIDGVGQTAPLVAELQSARPDAIVSFSSFYGDLTLGNGVSLFDALGVKFIGWQLDHPIYVPKALHRALQGRYAIYSNRNHLRYAQAVKLPGRGVTLMPGGELPAAAMKDHGARDVPILVAATWNGVPERLWEQTPDSPGKQLLMGVIDALMQDPKASLLDAFNGAAAKLGLGARLGDDPAFDAMMHDFLREPLTYVRNIDRINIIKALVDGGLPVTICGPGWEGLLGERKNVTYRGRIDFKDIQATYGDARVVLNLNASNGASERAIYAGLAGAAVVSDASDELDALLGEGRGVAFFNRTRPETVAQVVGDLVESGQAEAMGRQAHDTLAGSGLWRHRAQQMVDFAQGR